MLDAPRGPLRILLVDDHGLFLEGLHNLLTAEGLQVVGLAHDGLQALAQARRLQPHVILMDIQMPRCDGLTATRLIKAEMPDCRIVMLTMSEDEDDLFDAVKSGASGYLLKNLDAPAFFTYLTELQVGHPPFSPGLAEKILNEFGRQAIASESQTPPPAQVTTEEDGTRTDDKQTTPPAPHTLSPRQVQILTLVAQGKTYRETGEIIGIAERTVKYHMAEIIERLHLQNRAQVIAYAARTGLVRPHPSPDP
ncbi:MAG: response regulator [Anaerolineales bacterium]